MSRRKRQGYSEQEMELRGLCERLADLMETSGGSSAMVRVYRDTKSGISMCAANLYLKPGDAHVAPVVKFKDPVGAWRLEMDE